MLPCLATGKLPVMEVEFGLKKKKTKKIEV